MTTNVNVRCWCECWCELLVVFGRDLDELFVNFLNRQLWGLSTSSFYPALSLGVEVGMCRHASYGERQHQNEPVDSEPRRSNKQLVLLSSSHDAFASHNVTVDHGLGAACPVWLSFSSTTLVPLRILRWRRFRRAVVSCIIVC